MYQPMPQQFDREGPRAPLPAPETRIDAALDVIWIGPKPAELAA